MVAEVDRAHIATTCNTAVDRNNAFLKSISGSKDAFVQLAGAINMNGLDAAEQANELKAGVEKLIKLQAEVEAYSRALQEVQGQHQPPAAPHKTDYKALLQQRVDNDEQLRSLATERHPWLADLQQELGEEPAAANKQLELGDDDDLIINEEGMSAFAMPTCPLTYKRLLDIEDPVEDGLHYVYEREAVVQYIRGFGLGGSKATHPGQAVMRYLTLEELKPSMRVKREQRRVRMGQPSFLQERVGPADGEVVLNVDDA